VSGEVEMISGCWSISGFAIDRGGAFTCTVHWSLHGESDKRGGVVHLEHGQGWKVNSSMLDCHS